MIISCYFRSQLDPEERAAAGMSPAQSKLGKKLKIKQCACVGPSSYSGVRPATSTASRGSGHDAGGSNHHADSGGSRPSANLT